MYRRFGCLQRRHCPRVRAGRDPNRFPIKVVSNGLSDDHATDCPLFVGL